MLCKKPYMGGTSPFGCGQCLPCRINKSRQWMWRQVLESFSHERNAFVTLTYDDKNLPTNRSLQPRDLQLWLKRLRKQVSPRTFRFFGAGEYGEAGTRGINPHYHVSLFGLSGHTTEHGRGNRRFLTHYEDAEIIQKTWGMGDAFTAEFNAKTALYTSGYVIKRLTDERGREWHKFPKGLELEFMRSSRRPGIGAATMPLVAKVLNQTMSLEETGDVPHSLKMGTKNIPLGRFMLEKLRKAVGFTDSYIAHLKSAVSQETQTELLALLDSALAVDEEFTSATTVYMKEVQQRIANVESDFRIWQKKKGHL